MPEVLPRAQQAVTSQAPIRIRRLRASERSLLHGLHADQRAVCGPDHGEQPQSLLHGGRESPPRRRYDDGAAGQHRMDAGGTSLSKCLSATNI